MTDKDDHLARRLTCPRCGKDRVLGHTGVSCTDWNCGGIETLTSKQRNELRRYIRKMEKEDQRGEEDQRSAYLR